jgi:small subunit ribosomal protein S16
MKDPVAVILDEDRTLRWLQKGAQPTDTVRELLRKVGLMRRLAELRAKPQATPSSA